MSLEITGKLIRLLDEQKGENARGSWLKQEFLIETEEKFPKQICFAIWNERAAVLKSFQAGEHLKVAFDIESREYRGKYYTNLKAWSVELSKPSAAETTSQEKPFPMNPDPKPLEDITPESDNDILPF